MRPEQSQHDIRVQRRSNRSLGAIVAVQSVSLLVALTAIVCLIGSERTIIVPPAIDRAFWVTHDKASKEYLEQMAGYVAWLYLDVSPASIDWKRNALLNWVAPAQYGAVKTRMDLEADRLRNNNASSSFLPQQLTPDEKHQSVIVTGRLRRQINGADVGEPETRSYLAQFQYLGGRIHIESFKEIVNGPAAQARARAGAADPGAR